MVYFSHNLNIYKKKIDIKKQCIKKNQISMDQMVNILVRKVSRTYT